MITSEVRSSPKWIKLVRAIVIMAIVFDHAIYPNIGVNHLSETLYTVTNWWDVPMLFVLGGFEIVAGRPTWQFIREKIVPLLGTYFIGGALLIIASHFIQGDSWRYTGNFFLRLVYGGATLDGDLTLMWLFTVYLLTMVFVQFLLSWIDSPAIQVLIALAMFALGISYNSIGFLHFQYMPWGVDLVLLTTLWTLAGYYAKVGWPKMVYGRFYATAGAVIYLIIVFCRYEWGLNFRLLVKEHLIKTPYMAALVPLFVALTLLIIAEQVAKTHWLDWLMPVNNFAVPILCMTQLVMDVFGHISAFNHAPILWVLGILVPILIAGCYRSGIRLLKQK